MSTPNIRSPAFSEIHVSPPVVADDRQGTVGTE